MKSNNKLLITALLGLSFILYLLYTQPLLMHIVERGELFSIYAVLSLFFEGYFLLPLAVALYIYLKTKSEDIYPEFRQTYLKLARYNFFVYLPVSILFFLLNFFYLGYFTYSLYVMIFVVMFLLFTFNLISLLKYSRNYIQVIAISAYVSVSSAAVGLLSCYLLYRLVWVFIFLFYRL